MRAGRLGIAAGLLVLAGCGEGSEAPAPTPSATTARACTEIGCAPAGVVVDFSRMPNGDVEVVMCVEQQECVRSGSRGAPPQGIGDVLPRGRDSIRVALVVRKDGRVVARARKRMRVRISRPNGPDCPPPCRYVRARFDAVTGALEAA